MFIFVDESGSTDAKNNQKFLVVAVALANNRQFAEDLILEIKDQCKAKGKPIFQKELKYHNLSPFQREIAVHAINAKYRNFYVSFFDVERANRSLVTGRHEQAIQAQSIHLILSKLDKLDFEKENFIKVVMDKKLSEGFRQAIELEFRKHLGTKKGVSVSTVNSSRERGVQLADLIAGAFRSKLMKKSDLFQVDFTRVFQIPFSEESNKESVKE